MTIHTAQLVLIALLAAGCRRAPAPPTDPLDLPLPTDPGVRSGVFDNGLTWFAEPNAVPDHRLVLRLVVNVGSVLEDEDQLGLAHFVEHMAFNGTTHFPGNTLIEAIEAGGTRFGPHLNAHTGFDETVYELTVPTEDDAAVERAFLILQDWATGVTFADEEIEKERGVVLEEWRTRLGAAGRVTDETVHLVFWNSRYADRLPIGTKESLETFAPDALRRFYRDWYRPDLMAVIAVGDVGVDRLVALITQHFAHLPARIDPRTREQPSVPDHAETFTAIIADPEASGVGLSVLAKHDDVEENTHRSYRDGLVQQLALSIVNERLSERARGSDPPFLWAGASEQRLTKTEGGSVLSAGVDESGIVAGYRAVLQEVRQVREQGFLPGEIDRARARTLEAYGRLLLEKETTESETHAAEIVRVFTTGESMPGIDAEVEIARRDVPDIDAAELQHWAATWMPDSSRVVTVVLPDKPGLPVPTAAVLADVVSEIDRQPLAPRSAEVASVGELLSERPAAGAVVATDHRFEQALGFTGLTLSNGAQVWFKRTPFRADEIRMNAFSLGGTSTVHDAQVVPALTAIDIVGMSGIGRLDGAGVDRWLAGRTASLDLQLTETSEVASGMASADDLDAFLQMVVATFSEPRFSTEGLDRARERATAALRNRLMDPGVQFLDANQRVLWADDERRLPLTIDRLEAMDLDASRTVFTERFGRGGDFTFVFAGALPADFETLVARYLGALPVGAAEDRWHDRGKRPTRGAVATTVRGGLDAQARVLLAWHGPFEENTWETRNRLYALGDILGVQLREELRESLGGVYGVSVDTSESWEPARWYEIDVSFTCDPARVDELVAATERIVARLKDEGPSTSDVRDLQVQNRREREVSLRDNGFWIYAFGSALQRAEDPLGIVTWDLRNDGLSPASITEAARAWLDSEDTVKVVLLPNVDTGDMQHPESPDR